jgi:drug/metabolite transporter (DMT)-like permease
MKEGERSKMFAMGLVVICIFLGAFGQICMKTGMNQIEKINSISDLISLKIVISVLSNFYVVLGLSLYFIGAFLWLAAMSSLNISFMYPLLSLAYLVTAIFAFLYLGETITVVRWTGIALVIAGCFLIARS